jgi:hypothetical protein
MVKFYLLLSCFLIPAYSFSQISGIVFCKQTGKALSGAKIELERQGKPTNLRTATAEDGSFSIPSPSQGTYQLLIKCPGYKFYIYELVVYRQASKLVLSPIELDLISSIAVVFNLDALSPDRLAKNMP